MLAVETEFARSWVAQRYQAVLKDALFEVLGTDIAVEVVVVAGRARERPSPGSPPTQIAAARRSA